MGALQDKKRLVILDTHAILHRAYHALPDFSSSKGEPTGALYGLISMLVKIINDLKPDYIVAAYDLPGPTYRHAAYEKYKALRPKADDALVEQLKRSRDVLDAFGVPRFECPTFEADDVIGTIVEEMKGNKKVDLIIASGDMDALQLIDDERVRVFTLKKGLNDTVLYDEAGVVERFGFGPRSLIDYKGLRGDPSDNIPGVRGVGEKTAQVLIKEFGTLEKLYGALKKNKKKVEALGVKSGMLQKLLAGEEDAKFSKELATIRRDAPIDFKLPERPWAASVSPERVLEMLQQFEFRSLVPRVQKLLGAAAVPELPLEAAGEKIDEKIFAEVALATSVLDSNIANPTLEDIYHAGRSRNFAEARKNILAEIKERGLSYVYEKIELPLMPVLRGMERRGVMLDKAFLANLSRTYHKELDAITKRIYKNAGREFNINSPRQLSEVLFDELKLTAKNQKKTAGGQRSTRESELEKLKGLHPIIEDILAHRSLQKLLSTYIDTLPTLTDEKSRVHTHFIQIGAATGRLATQNPGLQNIPIKTELGRAIRHAFVADKGMKLVSLDYSQIELRIAAILSRDPALIDIFKKGRDVHAEVATRVFGVKEASYNQRRMAKVINFGILYGMGVNSLQQTLETSRKEAQEFYNQYFATFPRLAKYLEEVKADAAREGYTETLFGRRRYFAGITSSIPYVRTAAERMAINAPMQGTQSDIIKLAMVDIDAFFKKEGLGEKAYMLLQVHDELVFEIDEQEVRRVVPKLKELMEGVLPTQKRHGVPIVVEGKIGDNWGETMPL